METSLSWSENHVAGVRMTNFKGRMGHRFPLLRFQKDGEKIEVTLGPSLAIVIVTLVSTSKSTILVASLAGFVGAGLLAIAQAAWRCWRRRS